MKKGFIGLGVVIGVVLFTVGAFIAGDMIVTRNGLNSLWHLLPIGTALCGLGASILLTNLALGGKG